MIRHCNPCKQSGVLVKREKEAKHFSPHKEVKSEVYGKKGKIPISLIRISSDLETGFVAEKNWSSLQLYTK